MIVTVIGIDDQLKYTETTFLEVKELVKNLSEEDRAEFYKEVISPLLETDDHAKPIFKPLSLVRKIREEVLESSCLIILGKNTISLRELVEIFN